VIQTFVGVRGPGARRLFETARRLGASVVLAEPELTVLARPGLLDAHSDGHTTTLVRADAPVGTEGAAEAFANAFARFGEEAMQAYTRPAAVVHWDQSRKRGFAAVDRLGAQGVFFASTDDGLFFAGEIVDILNVMRRRPAPSLAALGSWLTGDGIPRGTTLYEGISRLRGGELHPLEQHSATRAYVTERLPDLVRGGPEELAERTRTALERAVDAAIGKAPVAAVSLSGGIDSGSVAAAACHVRGSRNALSFSAAFPDYPEADESSLVRKVRRQLDLDGSELVVRPAGLLRDALLYQSIWSLPSASPTLFFQLQLQQLAADAGAEVLLDGEGGDELFGLRPYLVADRLARGRAYAALRLAGSMDGRRLPSRSTFAEYGVRGAWPWLDRFAARRGARWLQPTIARAVLDTAEPWSPSGMPRWLDRAWDALTGQRERLEVHDYLRRRAAMTGLRTAHPLVEDLELIRFAAALPPEGAFRSQLDRPLLRAAMAGSLPAEVVARGEKSYFNNVIADSLGGIDRATFLALLDRRPEIEAVVAPEHIRLVVEAPPARRRGAWIWTAWRLAVAECWLRQEAAPERLSVIADLAGRSDGDRQLLSGDSR
jgi:asparagine synthase (glutamine-hydrolysing)